MANRNVKIWYDSEGDYLEVMFEQKEGYFRETSSDQVMEKVDADGNILGFSVLKVSALKEHPLEVTLTSVSGGSMTKRFDARTRPPPATTTPSPSPASRAPARSSCAPRRASRACGAIRASAVPPPKLQRRRAKRATSSPRSTPRSPRASTRAT